MNVVLERGGKEKECLLKSSIYFPLMSVYLWLNENRLGFCVAMLSMERDA